MNKEANQLIYCTQLYNITIHPKQTSDGEVKNINSGNQIDEGNYDKWHLLVIQKEQQIKQLTVQLDEIAQLNFILKRYVNKIDKIMYNQQSKLLDQKPLNYQKIQLYLRETMRRLQDINNNKLQAQPVIYRKNTIKCFKLDRQKT